MLSEEFVKRTIIQWLSRRGWGYFDFDELYSHGVDIKARKGGRVIFIETKGESKNHSGNEVRFVYGLGQLITRMKVVDAPRAFNYALAAPIVVANIALRRIPWKLAKRLTIDVLAVDHKGCVKWYTWRNLKETQSKNLKN
jgi:hypothetical protein